MTIREEIQVAIRLKQSTGYRYEQYRDNGPDGLISHIKLNLETAQKQLGLYTASSEPTIVVRKVIINEGPWEEALMSEEKELALILHKKQCHANHIDQCSWEYENWTGSTHKQFLDKARTILKRTNFNSAKELIELL